MRPFWYWDVFSDLLLGSALEQYVNSSRKRKETNLIGLSSQAIRVALIRLA